MNEIPKWQLDIYEDITEALRPFCWPETSNAIVEAIISWRTTRNPHHLDHAQILCFECGSPIPKLLQTEMAAAAKLRWEGEPGGKTKNIQNEQALSAALLLMLNLHHAGLSIPEASRKAESVFGQKASTLERRYGERMRPEPETRLRNHWKKIIPNHAGLWQPVIDRIPDPVE